MEKLTIPNRVEMARRKLLDGAYTCAVMTEDAEYCSKERGVKPLLALFQSGQACCGAVAADKTVGAGAAHLYVLLGIRALWANVISVSAQKILEENRIEVFYEKRVPYIINRQGDGVCPIESAVADVKASKDAYALIIATLERLSASDLKKSSDS